MIGNIIEVQRNGVYKIILMNINVFDQNKGPKERKTKNMGP